MRIGVLSDIHGNAPVLAQMLEQLRARGAERFFALGDCVGYLPGECEVLRLLDEAGAECQQGNHEAWMLQPPELAIRKEAVYRYGPARARLGPARLATIAAWPRQRELEIDGRRLLLVHGSPDAPLDGRIYPDSDLAPYAGVPYDLVFMGHTHRPFARRIGARLFVNVGSVGLPRDHGTAAAAALWDSASGEVRVLRVAFDSEAVLRACGDDVHEDVRARFNRRSPEPVEEIVA